MILHTVGVLKPSEGRRELRSADFAARHGLELLDVEGRQRPVLGMLGGLGALRVLRFRVLGLLGF